MALCRETFPSGRKSYWPSMVRAVVGVGSEGDATTSVVGTLIRQHHKTHSMMTVWCSN